MCIRDRRKLQRKPVTAIMIEEGHCVPYEGGSKEDTLAGHMANRKRLVLEGVVSAEEVEAAIKLMED